jgi:RNA polymerase sigma-70 factor (ECF subfamily)
MPDGSLERALELVEIERPRLLREIRRCGLCRADVDEILQIVVNDLALNWNERLAQMSLRELCACILRSANLRVIDAVRRERRRQLREQQFHTDTIEAPIDPERKIVGKRERVARWEVVRSLPADLLEPVLLLSERDMTCRQIAATLGLPIGTVKTRLRRARRLCRAPRGRAGTVDHGPNRALEEI